MGLPYRIGTELQSGPSNKVKIAVVVRRHWESSLYQLHSIAIFIMSPWA